MAGPVSQPVSKPGNAPIIKVGQTASNKFGSEPSAQTRGSTMPMNLEFGK